MLFYGLLDEQERRLYAGLEALKMGHGGDAQVAELLGLDPATVARGRRELMGGVVARGGARRPGGGRSPKATPEVIAAITELMEHDTAGDPVTGVKWTRRTTEKIALELAAVGIERVPEHRRPAAQ